MTPSGIAPASISRWTAVAEDLAIRWRRSSEPEVWGIPASPNDSLIVHGTPSSGGGAAGASGELSRASAASASARAASKRVATIAFTAGLRASISSMCASMTARAVSSRERIAAASSSAERSVRRGGAETASIDAPI